MSRLFLVALIITSGFLLFFSNIGARQLNFLHELTLEVIGPVQQLVSRASSSLQTWKDDYFDHVNVRRKNRELHKQLGKYRQDLNRCGEARATNIRLRRLLDFKNASQYPVLPAEIIGKDPSLWFSTVIVNRGAGDGVEKGMPVESVEGVVGRIQEVTPNYAKVLLAIAPSSAMDVMLQKSRAKGILKGQGNDVYSLKYIQNNVKVEKGDQVVTAGIGGLFPGGRAVGHISRVEKKRRGMFLEIEVTPSVDFRSLEELLIIRRERVRVDD